MIPIVPLQSGGDVIVALIVFSYPLLVLWLLYRIMRYTRKAAFALERLSAGDHDPSDLGD